MRSQSLSALRPLFEEVNDLKRITSAHRVGSIATRLFGEAWAALACGAEPGAVAPWITGRALAASRLGDLDRACMIDGGLTADEAAAVLRRAVDEVTGGLAIDPTSLRAAVAADLPFDLDRVPPFVADLAQQPRAGITCPGKPRVLLEPPESHADHCLVVAVYGVVLAAHYDADPVRVFLAAIAHHFHNAGMPDAGFTGEILLGSHLETMMARYNAACLDQLAPPLRSAVEQARAILPTADTAEGGTFHAADVLDRVLQVVQYTRASRLTTEQMLGEMSFVHAGPVKTFQDDVLRQAGLS